MGHIYKWVVIIKGCYSSAPTVLVLNLVSIPADSSSVHYSVEQDTVAKSIPEMSGLAEGGATVNGYRTLGNVEHIA